MYSAGERRYTSHKKRRMFDLAIRSPKADSAVNVGTANCGVERCLRSETRRHTPNWLATNAAGSASESEFCFAAMGMRVDGVNRSAVHQLLTLI